jgi:hypothetical protein
MKKSKKTQVYREIASAKEPKSRATRIRMLLKKNKEVFKDKQSITDFKEPVNMLIRRSRAVEFYEDASKGSFEFTHSDGTHREIYLEPSQQVSFDYGKRKFKGYICHEDFPLPLPEVPIVTADTINSIVEKTMMDMKKLNERKKEMQLKTAKYIMFAIAGGFILWMMYEAHVIDKIIAMITGSPYIPPSTVTTPVVTETVNNNNALQIVSQIMLVIFADIKGEFKTWLKY